MDENVQGPITEGLRTRGIDVLTVQEDMRTGQPDRAVLERAQELCRALFTRDDDFLALGAQNLREGVNFATIIYAHQKAIPYARCLDDLELLASVGGEDDLLNQIIHLPL